jgi:hypothetical protein
MGFPRVSVFPLVRRQITSWITARAKARLFRKEREDMTIIKTRSNQTAARNRSRRRWWRIPHGRPFASVVVFAWTMLLTVTLKALFQLREPRVASRRRPVGIYRFFRFTHRYRPPVRESGGTQAIQAST